MAAAALPIALVLGALAELAAGLLRWPLTGERAWWSGVTALWRDGVRLWRGDPGGRASVVEAGGAAAALLGAGVAAAGAIGAGPGDLPLLYLFLALAAAGALVVVGSEAVRAERAAAEVAFAVALATLFLRYGTYELDAVRGTQKVLGTGLALGPTLAAAGLVVAALVLVVSGAMRLPPRAAPAPAARSLLLTLCRWALTGSTSLLGAVLVAGGGLEEGLLSLALASVALAILSGAAEAGLARVPPRWRWMAAAAVAVLAAGSASAVVVA